MADTPNSKPRTMWLPVPALAVPVRLTFDASGDLDALARTLLRLISIRARDTEELTMKVGLPADLVNSVLADLLDRGLVEAGDGSRWTTGVDGGQLREGELHQGWAFIVPSSIPGVIPRIWLEKELPAMPIYPDQDAEMEIAKDLESTVERWLHNTHPSVKGGDANLSKMLRQLIDRDEVETIPWPPAESRSGFNPSDEEEEKKLDLPELGVTTRRPRIVSIDVDEHVRATTHRFHYVVVWSQVDFLPRVAGRAVALFHEPELIPQRFGPRPITNLVPEWLSADPELRSLLEHVEHHAEAMKKEFSIVLRLVGIEDEAALEREVDAHRERLERRSKLSTPSDRDVWGDVIDEVRDAWRWNVIARREPEKHIAVAQDRYAHAVEALIRTLRSFAMPGLEKWKDQYLAMSRAEQKRLRKERSNAGWVADRSGLTHIGTGLGPSREHLLRALEQLHRLPGTIENAEKQPAGTSITLWLLPIYLLDDDEAEDFARPLVAALERHPLLMDAVSDLLELRNATFHQRDVPLEERDDRKLFEVWASLAEAYRSSASVTRKTDAED